MLESLLGNKRRSGPQIAPVSAFNFDRGVSYASPPSSADRAMDSITKFASVQSNGYGQALWTLGKRCNITPLSPLNFDTKDFTIELWFWMQTGLTGYSNLIYLSDGVTYGLVVRFGDDGFGNRLQISVNAGALSRVYSAPLTRAQLQGTWHHLALVRKDGKAYLYVDGVVRQLATGTGTNYGAYADWSMALPMATSFYFGDDATGFYIPEFAVFNYAKYLAGFTPPQAPIYSP